jgi:hypothetical protein
MSLSAKKDELAKLFLSFPQSARWETQQVAMMIAAYLEVLSGFSAGVIGEACRSFRKRATQFPPSSGEVFTRCESIAAKLLEDKRWRNRGRLPALSSEQTEEQRAAVKARLDDLVADLKHRAASGERRDGWRPPTHAEADAWLEAHAGGVGVKPVTYLSPELAQQIYDMAWGAE